MENKNETKHTQGPWKIYHNGVSTAPYVIYSGEGVPSVDSNGYLQMPGCKYICKVSSEIIDGDSEDTWFFSGDANARLIASAPAILKENQELKEMIENKGAQIDQSIENWNALKHEYDKMEAQYKYCQELNQELLKGLELCKSWFDKPVAHRILIINHIDPIITKAKAQ